MPSREAEVPSPLRFGVEEKPPAPAFSSSSSVAFLFRSGLRGSKSNKSNPIPAPMFAGEGGGDGVRARLDDEEADVLFFDATTFAIFFITIALV